MAITGKNKLNLAYPCYMATTRGGKKKKKKLN
jgi:hypothetical protein